MTCGCEHPGLGQVGRDDLDVMVRPPDRYFTTSIKSHYQSLRERDNVKAIIFFILTALLATVAGLITHFDALGHAIGLPVTDARISGIILVWVMTALRAVVVIGFLLASRLKEVSFQHLRQQWSQEVLPSKEQCQEQAVPQIDYQALASALVGAMQ